MKLLIIIIIVVVLFVILSKCDDICPFGNDDCVCGSNCKCGPGCKCSRMEMFSGHKSNLGYYMRRLWYDHVIWTRLFIISSVNGLVDEDFNLERLLKNQKDIGTVFGKRYGEVVGQKVESLLKEHIMIAGDIVEAAKEGNNAIVAKLETDWRQNADEISMALSGLNRVWNYELLKAMMNDHLNLTKKEAVAIISGDNMTSINSFDQVMDQIERMADMMTLGF